MGEILEKSISITKMGNMLSLDDVLPVHYFKDFDFSAFNLDKAKRVLKCVPIKYLKYFTAEHILDIAKRHSLGQTAEYIRDYYDYKLFYIAKKNKEKKLYKFNITIGLINKLITRIRNI